MLLRLKLRLVACAHGRVTSSRPPLCGARCLALLSTELRQSTGWWWARLGSESVSSRFSVLLAENPKSAVWQ